MEKKKDSKEYVNVEANGTNAFKNYPDSKKRGSGFAKSVLVPLASGMLGTVIIIGLCFGVPTIRKTILNEQDTNSQLPAGSTSSSSNSNSNANLISLSNFSDTGVGVAKKVLPSIVGIQVEYSVNSVFYRNASTATAEGSGVIISEDGYILTNNHVISSSTTSTSSYYEVGKANKITVYLYDDEIPYEAKVIGTDEQTDLAVIKIDKTGLTKAELGDSGSLQVGEFCMAVGNPLGMRSSVSSGMISALNREITDSDGKTFSLIQTDTAINQGNSGGALVNSNGEVIGINTLKASGTGVEGMGFAIPINSTKAIYEELIQYQKVRRPYIGINGMNLDEQTAKQYNLPVGIYVRTITDFSPAQKADIRNGDVVTKINGTTIKTMDELNKVKNEHQIGDKIKLTIVRDGSEKEIEITLEEQP